MSIGLIGGSGLYALSGLERTEEVTLTTPYGAPSAAYRKGLLDGRELIFLPRHGSTHTIPPHKVNYRANIWGFKSLGVTRLISISAVGGISKTMRPGNLIMLDQIIDMTGGSRSSTFYEDRVIHVDFTSPYCTELRGIGAKAAQGAEIPLASHGTYICVNGPRLETAREILFYSQIGADVVGMTAMPEAALAREVEICMLGIAVVTNYAAGIVEKKLTTTEVLETMQASTQTLKALIKGIIPRIPSLRTCACKDALKEAEL